MEDARFNEAPYIYGAVGALADNDLSMEEMFTYAIQDEQLAHEEYAYVLETFGDQAPFNNIISAEAQHITEMTVLFEKYDLAIPADESADHIKRAADIKERHWRTAPQEKWTTSRCTTNSSNRTSRMTFVQLSRLYAMLRKDIWSRSERASRSIEKSHT